MVARRHDGCWQNHVVLQESVLWSEDITQNNQEACINVRVATSYETDHPHFQGVSYSTCAYATRLVDTKPHPFDTIYGSSFTKEAVGHTYGQSCPSNSLRIFTTGLSSAAKSSSVAVSSIVFSGSKSTAPNWYDKGTPPSDDTVSGGGPTWHPVGYAEEHDQDTRFTHCNRQRYQAIRSRSRY